MTDRIAALDIIGGPPLPCSAQWRDAGWVAVGHDTTDHLFLVRGWVPTGHAETASAHIREVEVFLDENGDQFGMVQHALRRKLNHRVLPGYGIVSDSTLVDKCFDMPWSEPFRGDGLNRWVPNAHRYIARTDRLCKRQRIRLDSGDVAEWFWREDKPDRGDGWWLKTKYGTWWWGTLGVSPDDPLWALTTALKSDVRITSVAP